MRFAPRVCGLRLPFVCVCCVLVSSRFLVWNRGVSRVRCFISFCASMETMVCAFAFRNPTSKFREFQHASFFFTPYTFWAHWACCLRVLSNTPFGVVWQATRRPVRTDFDQLNFVRIFGFKLRSDYENFYRCSAVGVIEIEITLSLTIYWADLVLV